MANYSDYAYAEHICKHPEQANIVTHPEDPACPGHDINLVLIDKSREIGWCLCIHPLMQVVDFAGLDCGWCGQAVTKAAVTPGAKELRTQTILAVLGDGSGKCTG